MVTPCLEKLILNGKASYKTFVAGGSSKNILEVGVNRWIVITDFVYFPFLPSDALTPSSSYIDPASLDGFNLTQMNIFSNKSFNAYVFKNSFNHCQDKTNETYITPGAPIQIDTFLTHEQDVSFTFLKENPSAAALTTTDLGNSPTGVKNLKPPLDYGGDGLAGSITVPRRRDFGAIAQIRPLGTSIAATVNPNFSQLQLPVDALTDIKADLGASISYPVVNVGYVEIFGVKRADITTSS
jgi:hypothetical protein